jgi:hypothetical protein
LTDVIENVIALTALLGVIYISFCFIKNKNSIRALIEDLAQFEAFSPMSLIHSTEKSAQFYTKLFIFYGLVGNFCYGLMPLLHYRCARKTKRSTCSNTASRAGWSPDTSYPSDMILHL